MFSALGFSLPGGQISAKGGNLVVHIYASGFLPKHYPGGSGFNLQSLEGRAWRVRGWKTVSVRAVLCCSQVGMYTCVEFGRLGCTCIILDLLLACSLAQA